MSALTRKSSFGASLDTLPLNPNLKAHPTVAFKGSTLEPLDDVNGSRNKSITNKTYWQLFFKGIIKTAQVGHTHKAAHLLKTSARNFLV
ncbi:MAG TPA: hypothetical protein VIJ14_09075, partial [Rhabdochlamydiaceae bacterium]